MRRALPLAFALCAASLLSWMGWLAVPWVVGAAVSGWWAASQRRPIDVMRLMKMTATVGAPIGLLRLATDLQHDRFVWMLLPCALSGGACFGALGALPLAPIVFAAELAPGGPIAQGAAIRRTLMTAALVGLVPGFVLQAATEQQHIVAWLSLHALVIAICAAGDVRARRRLRRAPSDPPATFSYRESAWPIPSVREDPSRAARILSWQLGFDAVVLAVLATDAWSLAQR